MKTFTGELWGVGDEGKVYIGPVTVDAENRGAAREKISEQAEQDGRLCEGDLMADVRELALVPTGEKLIEQSLTTNNSLGHYGVRTQGILLVGWGWILVHSEMDGPYNVYLVEPERLEQLKQQYPDMGWY